MSRTGLSPPVVVPSSSLPLSSALLTPWAPRPGLPHNPGPGSQGRFGLFPVRSPLLRESRLISVPGGTEMFHFPPFASRPKAGWPAVKPAGFPHSGTPESQPAERLVGAFRSLPRPSSRARA
jgi:hypothetical protein